MACHACQAIAHALQEFFEVADIARNAWGGRSAAAISQIALAAVQRIDALFDIEHPVSGASAKECQRVRQEKSAPLLAELEACLSGQQFGLSRSAAVGRPIDCMLKRWSDFVHDGSICLTNNAAEHALRGLALGRRAWLFAGSDLGVDRASVMFSLIVTAKLNGVDPQAWLVDVFARIASIPQSRLHELMPWKWKELSLQAAA